MKISVITINYNNCPGLKQTIGSVLAQTFGDFEYIVIDGGSNDGSATVVEEYAESLAYGCSEPDGGIYDAMNKGVGHASGDYVIFLNSGDVFADCGVLADVAGQLGDADIVYGDLTFRYPDRDFTRRYPSALTAAFFLRDSLPHPAAFIRRELLARAPYDTDYKIVSDWIFFMKSIVVDGCSYRHVDRTVSIFAVDGVSTNHDRESGERSRALSELFSPMLLDSIRAQGLLEACGLDASLADLASTRKLRKRLRPLLNAVIASGVSINNIFKRR